MTAAKGGLGRTPRTIEAPRPGFADELLARLELVREHRGPRVSPAVRKAAAGAAVASLAFLAGLRRSR